ncbi:hypothetical protein MAPG_10861, partial [Magnaporthiopsis poae ATCC 64411]
MAFLFLVAFQMRLAGKGLVAAREMALELAVGLNPRLLGPCLGNGGDWLVLLPFMAQQSSFGRIRKIASAVELLLLGLVSCRVLDRSLGMLPVPMSDEIVHLCKGRRTSLNIANESATFLEGKGRRPVELSLKLPLRNHLIAHVHLEVSELTSGQASVLALLEGNPVCVHLLPRLVGRIGGRLEDGPVPGGLEGEKGNHARLFLAEGFVTLRPLSCPALAFPLRVPVQVLPGLWVLGCGLGLGRG